jgi:parvulin-like peptidyl-prolyl isomerase
MELLNKLVEEEVFYQEALRRGMDKKEEFTDRMEQIRRGILASMVKKELYEMNVEVKDAELKEYFDKNPDKFQTPESVKVKLILVRLKRGADEKETAEAKAKADAAYAKLKKGASWDKIVEEYSDDRASKKKAGLLPSVRKGLRGEEFDKVAFAMTKPGEISAVFQDKRGFNVLQFVEKEEAKLKDFEEVKKTIERRLKQERQKDKMDSTIKGLRDKAKVVIHEDVLDSVQVDVGPEGAPGAPGAPGMPGAEGQMPTIKPEGGEGAPAAEMQQKLMEMMKAKGEGAAAPSAAPEEEEE